MGQLDVMSIIAVAVPALMFIYPITILLIILNALPDKWTTVLVFRSVVIATILFSAPDFWASLGFSEQMKGIQEFIPLGTVSLGWLLPAVITLIAVNVLTLSRKRTT